MKRGKLNGKFGAKLFNGKFFFLFRISRQIRRLEYAGRQAE
jgi:hypothetical protein